MPTSPRKTGRRTRPDKRWCKACFTAPRPPPPGDLFFAEDYDLDDDKIEDVAPILINDADASQHSAVIDVMKGRNLVVEGPPGTGKSQTITNILANALYAGKTVLFLADKLAALQVVKGRMDAAGLGEFCLELHSDKAQPKSIILSLQQRYEMGRDRGYEPAWPIDLRKLRSARGRVREYLSALHARDEADGRTPFELFWSAIAGRHALDREFEAVRRIDLSEIFSGRPEKIEEYADALKLFVAAVESYEQRYGRFANSPWTKANFAPAPDCEPRMIADLMRDAHDAALRLLEIVAARSAKLQIELPRLPSRLLDWMAAAGRLPVIPEDSLLGPGVGVHAGRNPGGRGPRPDASRRGGRQRARHRAGRSGCGRISRPAGGRLRGDLAGAVRGRRQCRQDGGAQGVPARRPQEDFIPGGRIRAGNRAGRRGRGGDGRCGAIRRRDPAIPR